MMANQSETSLDDALAMARRLVPCAQREFPGAMVVLFGSYAKGCANEYSDIDVAVLPERYPEGMTALVKWEKLCALSKAAFEIDDRIEVVLRPLDDASGFVDTILCTGVRVD